MKIVPLSDHMGADILDVDLARLDDADLCVGRRPKRNRTDDAR